MLPCLLFVLWLALPAPPALAQTKSGQHSPPLAEARPRRAGMSTERLARIDALFEQAVAEGKIPGAVALVARRGKIVYHKAFGLADQAAGRRAGERRHFSDRFAEQGDHRHRGDDVVGGRPVSAG